uniref:Uncharacterized protein n=1 Tax=Trichogramma kaykai TaxID=54128 RepID=A0ABD2WHV5_9HYME
MRYLSKIRLKVTQSARNSIPCMNYRYLLLYGQLVLFRKICRKIFTCTRTHEHTRIRVSKKRERERMRRTSLASCIREERLQRLAAASAQQEPLFDEYFGASLSLFLPEVVSSHGWLYFARRV